MPGCSLSREGYPQRPVVDSARGDGTARWRHAGLWLRSAGQPLRVGAELDARGEIDRHTAMCLRLTVSDIVAGEATRATSWRTSWLTPGSTPSHAAGEPRGIRARPGADP